MEALKAKGYTITDPNFDGREPGYNRVLLGVNKDGMRVVLKMMDEKYTTNAFHEYIVHKLAQSQDLEGKYIGKLLEILKLDEKIYIITKYYDAGTLADYINSSESALNSDNYDEKWYNIAESCRKCIKFLHEKGIYHLDIKPDNFVFSDETQTSVLLIDFGLSQCMDTIPDDFIYGTKYFCPPYRTSSPKYIDNFGLGIILNLLYFGAYPFDIEDFDRIEEGKLNDLVVKKEGKRNLYENGEYLGLYIDSLLYCPRC